MDLLLAEDWDEWEKAEWLQLNQYQRQNMFGTPCPLPQDKGIFNLVWSHYRKTDGTNSRKVRYKCNRSLRLGQAHTLDHTYASCVNQNAARLFYANAALNRHVISGTDASNAFGEAPCPNNSTLFNLKWPSINGGSGAWEIRRSHVALSYQY